MLAPANAAQAGVPDEAEDAAAVASAVLQYAQPVQGPPDETPRIKEVALAASMGFVEGAAEGAGGPSVLSMDRVEQGFSKLAPGALFSEWSVPPRAADTNVCHLVRSLASPQVGEDVPMALLRGRLSWTTPGGRPHVALVVHFRSEMTLSRVEMAFETRPGAVSVVAGDDGANAFADDERLAAAQVDGSDVALLAFAGSAPTRDALSLSMARPTALRAVTIHFRTAGSRGPLALSSLSLFAPRPGISQLSPRSTLAQLSRWALRTAQEDETPAARAAAVRAAVAAAVATDAGGAAVHAALAVLSCAEGTDSGEIEAAAARLCDHVSATVAARLLSLSGVDTAVARLARPVGDAAMPQFDPAISSTSMRVTDGGMRMRSTTGDSFCALSAPITSGRATWSMRLLRDSENDEKCCFGIVQLPCSNPNYRRSRNMWMWRAYNGQLYAQGESQERAGKVKPGDVVTLSLDVDAGTLSLGVNTDSLRVAFRGVRGPVHPAVAVYGEGVEVELVSWAHTQGGDQSPPLSHCAVPLWTAATVREAAGVGSVGRGGDLGYPRADVSAEERADEEDRAGDGSVPSFRRASVAGAHLPTLSLHPAPGTDGLAEFDVREVVAEGCALLFAADAALCDDVAGTALAGDLCWSIEVDGACVWRARMRRGTVVSDQPVAPARILLPASARRLLLRTTAEGGSDGMHALWVAPTLVLAPANCIARNDLDACAAFGARTLGARSLSPARDAAVAWSRLAAAPDGPGADVGGEEEARVQDPPPLRAMAGADAADGDAADCGAAVLAALAVLGGLAQVEVAATEARQRAAEAAAKAKDKQQQQQQQHHRQEGAAGSDDETPTAMGERLGVDASPDGIHAVSQCGEYLLQQCGDGQGVERAGKAASALTGLFRFLHATLGRIVAAEVSPASVGISDRVVAPVQRLLQRVCTGNGVPSAVREAAAHAETCGMQVLHSTPRARAALLRRMCAKGVVAELEIPWACAVGTGNGGPSQSDAAQMQAFERAALLLQATAGMRRWRVGVASGAGAREDGSQSEEGGGVLVVTTEAGFMRFDFLRGFGKPSVPVQVHTSQPAKARKGLRPVLRLHKGADGCFERVAREAKERAGPVNGQSVQ